MPYEFIKLLMHYPIQDSSPYMSWSNTYYFKNWMNVGTSEDKV